MGLLTDCLFCVQWKFAVYKGRRFYFLSEGEIIYKHSLLWHLGVKVVELDARKLLGVDRLKCRQLPLVSVLSTVFKKLFRVSTVPTKIRPNNSYISSCWPSTTSTCKSTRVAPLTGARRHVASLCPGIKVATRCRQVAPGQAEKDVRPLDVAKKPFFQQCHKVAPHFGPVE